VLKLILAFGSILVCLQTAQAQIRQFPYQATIEEDDVYVRSGPGRRYYSTAKLKRGIRVTVHRHDPGGWYMIAPPENSFSWVRAKYVKKLLNNRGTLKKNNVIVRVGSHFGDDHDVEQVRLSIGDEVEILSEKTFETTQGKIRMYKISPPRGEFRWISGRAVSPADAIAKQQNDLDPYTIPSNAERLTETKTDNKKFGGYREHKIVRNQSTSQKDVSESVVRQQSQKLEELDNRFREMIQHNERNWDFRSLEKGYDKLNRQVEDDDLRIQLAKRFPALEKYKRIKQDYDELMKITGNSSQVDQNLMSRQRTFYPSAQVLRTNRQVNRQPQLQAPRQIQIRKPVPDPRFRRPTDPRFRQPIPQQNLRYSNRRTRRMTSRPRRQATLRRTPRFDGAGIIQQTAHRVQGVPRYVLLAPGGRILAYLQAQPGVNLAAYLGRSWGIRGKREFRKELGTDLLSVQQLTPVRLKQ